MTSEQIVSQFQQILNTMQRMIDASADLAARIDALEQMSGDIAGKMTSVDGTMQLMLESIETASGRQVAAYGELSQRVAEIEARLKSESASNQSSA